MKIASAIIVLASVLINAEAGEFYRWVDNTGKVHYGDLPPVSDTTQIEKKKSPSSTDTDYSDLPYLTRHAMESFPVTLYSLNNCIEACQKAQDFLTKRGIPFSQKKLSTQEELDKFIKLSGNDKMPTLEVGHNFLRGFEAEQWTSELDIAGYPKVAPYRPKVEVPPLPDKTIPESKTSSEKHEIGSK